MRNSDEYVQTSTSCRDQRKKLLESMSRSTLDRTDSQHHDHLRHQVAFLQSTSSTVSESEGFKVLFFENDIMSRIATIKHMIDATSDISLEARPISTSRRFPSLEPSGFNQNRSSSNIET